MSKAGKEGGNTLSCEACKMGSVREECCRGGLGLCG